MIIIHTVLSHFVSILQFPNDLIVCVLLLQLLKALQRRISRIIGRMVHMLLMVVMVV
jgi:hypothetical protein